MRTLRCGPLSILLLYVCAEWLVGCASLSQKTAEPEELEGMAEAQAVLLALSNQNRTLNNFKGIGKIKAWQEGVLRFDERIAWIGSETVKISIVVLISGHPAIKMASDGKWFYYYEARQDEPVYKKTPATDATLKRIVSIPIKASDIIQLLAGRVPLRKHHTAFLHRETTGTGYVLTLKKRWWGIVEKVVLEADKAKVRQVELFNRSGSLIYRARFDEMQMVDGYQVPARLSIFGNGGVGFQLEIQRYLADVPVNPSMFVLEPPK